jgi:hypothetical protein
MEIEFTDYFAKKRAELGMDRGDVLTRIQATLDAWYPGAVRAKRLHQGVLTLLTPSASVASELRMRQVEFLQVCELEAVRLSISISQLRA